MTNRYTLEEDALYAERGEIPVFWQGDVIVAGGGPAGLGAHAARRSGARVLLIERHAFLGGMCAFGSGMPLGGAYPSSRTIGGVAEDILSRTANAGPESASVREIPHFGRWFYHDSEYFKSLAVTLPYILFGVDVQRVLDYKEEDPGFEKAKLRALKDGLEIASTDRFQSCAAGMRPDHLFSNMIRITGVDATDAAQLTQAEMEARRRVRQHVVFLRGYIPGCENAYVGHTSEQMGIRDTRRIVGERRLETQACLECWKPADTILRCMGPIDNATTKTQRMETKPRDVRKMR